MKDTELGRRVTPSMVRRIIEASRPDYIQYDCKGHPGVLGYPESKVSASSPGILRDSLAVYRRETARRGIALYVHFSGVWDVQACIDHPEWQAVSPDRKNPFTGKTSLFSDYLTRRMIPQMKEVVDRYRVDGFWVDGDCWAVTLDHCREALRRFRVLTGLRKPPTGPDQPHWVTWSNIHRDQFIRYVTAYTDALHKYSPGIQMASNWFHSHFAPGPNVTPMDFASGDYSAQNSVNSARLASRCLADSGLPWDLMAWAFAWHHEGGPRGYKPAEQLMQEAAAVLPQGGGFQMYFHPDRHGGFANAQVGLMKRVADFCHARRKVCFRTVPVPQVALILDVESYHCNTRSVYAPYSGEYNGTEGILHAMLDAGHSVDIVASHNLTAKLSGYPVAVLPEWHPLSRSVRRTLADYVRNGGSLFVIGARTSAGFLPSGGLVLRGGPKDRAVNVQVTPDIHNASEAGAFMVKGLWQDIRARRGVRVVALRTPGTKEDEGEEPAVVEYLHGKGRIVAAFGPLGSAYLQNHSPLLRDLIDHTLRRLYRPIVRIEGSRTVEVTVRRKDDLLLIHLTNTAGMPTHTDKSAGYVFQDRVPPVSPLTVHVRSRKSPKTVTMQPDGRRLRFIREPGGVRVSVPQLSIHATLVVKPNK